jgi:hypothetical protein
VIQRYFGAEITLTYAVDDEKLTKLILAGGASLGFKELIIRAIAN